MMITKDEYLEFYNLNPDSVNSVVLETSLGAVQDLIDYQYRIRSMSVASERIEKGLLSRHILKLVVCETTKKYYSLLNNQERSMEDVESFSENIGEYSQSFTVKTPTGFKLSDSFMQLLGMNVITSQNLKI